LPHTHTRRFGIRHERAGDASARFEQDVDPTIAALAPLRHALATWLESREVGERARHAVILATHEAVANAIQHSGTAARITVRADAEPDGLTIEITDGGAWRIPVIPPPIERGRGLDLIRSLVTDATINTGAEGTTVRLHQRRYV
jgi:anti-sigma regulatory factor (Ser/Thr protein kinase)